MTQSTTPATAGISTRAADTITASPSEAGTAKATAEGDSGASAEERTPSFDELGLSRAVLAAVSDLGYETPSPVQAQAIPYVIEGRDVLAAAQTGTGKTAAFLLPTMSRLAHASRGHGPYMLVVTPTRELAQQIEDVCLTVAKRTGHSSATIVGGVGYEPQKRALRRGCDILVATPGRLVDLIDQGEAKLGEVEVLVLDEADRMLDMGFLPAMRKIVGQIPEERQTLLFSATLDEKQIGGIRDLVRDPAVVEIAHKGTVAETIDQYVLPVSLDAKNELLASVLKAESPAHTIVFCRTKHRADACCRRLRRAGISCAAIHGDRSQAQRERALKSFRADKTDVLVATDVLARGIDVSDVRYVINFDVPVDAEDYIHRIGRTGRAGEAGWALTFVTVNDFEDLRDCERLMGQIVPDYPHASEFELGEELPELDPDRTAEGTPAPKTRRRKRGGRKGAGSAAEGTGSANGGRTKKANSRAAGRREGVGLMPEAPRANEQAKAGQDARPKRRAQRPEAPQEDFELLSEKEVRAIERSAGRRGQQGSRGRQDARGQQGSRNQRDAGNEREGGARRQRGSQGSRGPQGQRNPQGSRGPQGSRNPQGNRNQQGSRGPQGNRARTDQPRGNRGGYSYGGGRKTSPAAGGGKPRRRVGDRKGRSNGIY